MKSQGNEIKPQGLFDEERKDSVKTKVIIIS